MLLLCKVTVTDCTCRATCVAQDRGGVNQEGVWHAGREDKYEAFLQEVVSRTAHMVALWQSVGFVHGVCNTDNFSILGETIDYGCLHNLLQDASFPTRTRH